MSIVKMKQLRVLALEQDRSALLAALLRIGCVEISEPDDALADPEWAALLQKGAAQLLDARGDLTAIRSALDALQKHCPAKSGLFPKRSDIGEAEFLSEEALADSLARADEIGSLARQLAQVQTAENRLNAQRASLVPWADTDLPLDHEGTEHTATVFGVCPAGVDPGQLVNELAEAAPMAELFLAASDKEQHYLLLICHRSQEEEALAALRPHSFSVLNFRELTGTAAENLADLDRELAHMAAQRESLLAQLNAMGQYRQALQISVDRLNGELAKQAVQDKLLTNGTVLFFQGWLPAEEGVPRLEEALSPFSCAWETADPAPEEYSKVPVKLKNNPLTAPYSVITGMYSLPSYDGLDPNPFIMPFFALFFGIMFADMAYGLLMFLAGLIILKKFQPKGTIKDMMGLLIQCGISAFVIGFLTGGFFGDAVSVVGGIFGKDWNIVPYLGTIRIGDSIAIDLPLNLLEGNNPLYVLILAMILGVIHLAVGVGIGVYLNIRDKNWLAVIADLSWWCIFAGIAVMILAGNNILLYVGIAIMVISAFLQGKGFGRITGIFGAVYNGVTGYLGDILSYSRLMALMLAGSVIASVFNQLGALGGLLLFIPVAIVGHLLNFALNLIGCFVHTMRLQFLEFFGKWYRDGGRPFQPLRYNTKYVDIKED